MIKEYRFKKPILAIQYTGDNAEEVFAFAQKHDSYFHHYKTDGDIFSLCNENDTSVNFFKGDYLVSFAYGLFIYKKEELESDFELVK